MDIQQYELTPTEIEFLAQKEKEGNLVSMLSNEFSGNADQITITPESGKIFFLVGIKLYPIVDTIKADNGNRRAYVVLTFDGTPKDFLTHDMESKYQFSPVDNAGAGAAGQTGQFTGLAKGISMTGNGSKKIKMTSSNTSGTYRVGILGYYEDS